MNCTIENCEASARARGLCKKHYNDHYRAGTLDSVGAPQPKHSLSDIDESTHTATCVICGPVSAVHVRTSGQWRCKKQVESNKRHRHAESYGLTREEATRLYESLWEEQDGLCALCGLPEPLGRRLALDHCHTNGYVRGLLCTRCNTALGLFSDNTETLQRAIEYLSVPYDPMRFL